MMKDRDRAAVSERHHAVEIRLVELLREGHAPVLAECDGCVETRELSQEWDRLHPRPDRRSGRDRRVNARDTRVVRGRRKGD
jgi:hypothetical protein